MPQPTTRRRPRARLLLTLAALLSLLVGYYLGQYWQRRPLADLTAVVYPAGQPIEMPQGLLPEHAADTAPWRLFVSVDTTVDACDGLLRHYAFVFNRLAAWPDTQRRLRLTALAYDRPEPAASERFTGGVEWAELIGSDPVTLDALAGQLGILPDTRNWCGTTGANAVLVSPAGESWALIPRDEPAIMARNIATVIDFVE